MQFTPQATLLVKIYTVDVHSKELVTVGYSVLNIFVRKGTETQPSADDADKVVCAVNDGGHQLPLYTRPPESFAELSMASYRGTPVVPCASLLVRLVNPPQVQGKLLTSATVPKVRAAF